MGVVVVVVTIDSFRDGVRSPPPAFTCSATLMSWDSLGRGDAAPLDQPWGLREAKNASATFRPRTYDLQRPLLLLPSHACRHVYVFAPAANQR